LLVAAAFLGACEQKAPIVNVEIPQDSPAVTLRLVPQTLNIAAGAQGTLTAVVEGSANQGATFSSSNSAITVTATSTTGVATVSVAAGTPAGTTATITAISTARNTARDAAVVTVSGSTGTGGADPTISIKSITGPGIGGLLTPVNPNAVVGLINVTLNVDIPVGSDVNRLEVYLDGDRVDNCTQSFTSQVVAGVDMNSQAPVEIVCTINTAEFDVQDPSVTPDIAPGTVTYPNKTYALSAKLIMDDGDVGAEISQILNFRNPNFLVATVDVTGAQATGGLGVAPAGSLWEEGDVVVNVLPVVFTTPATDALARATISLSTVGGGVNGLTGCRPTGVATTDPTIAPAHRGVAGGATLPFCGRGNSTQTDLNPADGISVTFSETVNPGANGGAAGIEDVVFVTVTGITIGGQAGPICVNPDPINNPIGPCAVGGGLGNPGVGIPGGAGVVFSVNPIRLDNLAPRFTYFNMINSNSTLAQQNQYFGNQELSATMGGVPAGAPVGAATVDYGVDAQTTTFQAGTAVGSLTAIDNTNDLPQSTTSQVYIAQAITTDALLNTRTGTATTNPRFIADAAASAASLAALNTAGCTNAVIGGACSIATFGVDLFAPETQAVGGPANNSTNPATTTFTLTPIDRGDPAVPNAGPSGFSTTPFTVRAELVNAQGTFCYNLDPQPGETDAEMGTATGGRINCATGGPNGDGTFNVNRDGVFTLAAGVQGYWVITWTLTDLAGNTSTATVRITLIDTTSPTLGNIVVPTTIQGNGTVEFLAGITENVDLRDIQPFIGYHEGGDGEGGALNVHIEQPITVIGAYGVADGLVTQSTGRTTVENFVRSIEASTLQGCPAAILQSAGGGTTTCFGPSGQVSRATDVHYRVRDVALNAANAEQSILAGVAQGIGGNGMEPTTFGSPSRPLGPTATGGPNPNPSYQAFTVVSSANTTAANICEDTDTDGCTTPTVRTVNVSVTGAAQTFDRPFDRVIFYYQHPTTGRWIPFSVQTNAGATDNTNLNTRIWTYSAGFDAPAGFAAGTVFNVMTLGVDPQGRALMSNTLVFTQVAD
jgi:hypothetical protein